MTHTVRITESQTLVVTPAGHIAYDPQVSQWRCSCGWHTDAVEVRADNVTLRDELRRLAHRHALDGRS